MATENMWEHKKIGVVREVSSSTVLAELDPELTSLAKKLGDKTYYIGQVGTYVMIPIENIFVIGVVDAFRKADVRKDDKTVSRYYMSITIAGTIRKGKFETGALVMPTADMEVFLLEHRDMKAALAAYQKFDFSIGTLSLFETERAFLDPNRFFSKHLAVLGSSGAGKSSAVASILQKIAGFPDAHVILLDLHNEYAKAFPQGCRHFDIASLELPYWFMNSEELFEMFIEPGDEHASVQSSLLQQLILEAKREANPELKQILTVDTPVYFDLNPIRVRLQFLDTERIAGPSGVKEGPYYGRFTRLLIRLESRMNDPRYAFMFKPQICLNTESIKPMLMMMFGLDGNSRVTIMDLSGIPFDIVRTVAALVGRISFDFNFWNPQRTNLPILLVFEEAHNYLSTVSEGSRAARKIVERIAKEGRKYGVSCMIVSQRPSEISETILSQCSNFLILKLLNPADQAYIRNLVPDSFSGLDHIIPLLRPGEAVVVGDATPMPQRVQLDYPNPAPQGSSVLFFDRWKQTEGKTDVNDVMDRWWHQRKT